MYELNGQQYTLEQVQNAANQSNLSLDEYISKVGLKKILESSPDFQSPTMPGAVVGDSQAPDMGLGSGSGSLESLVPTEVLLGKPREEKPKPTSFPGALLDKAEELGENRFTKSFSSR
jgi:hypothetical protein